MCVAGFQISARVDQPRGPADHFFESGPIASLGPANECIVGFDHSAPTITDENQTDGARKKCG